MNADKLAVAETFLSIQGEGQTAGRPAYFLRLAGCNLMCGGRGTEKDGKLHNGATWRCDSIEVWLKGQAMPFAQVVGLFHPKFIEDLYKHKAHLIITGGEPLLQAEAICNFLIYLREEYSCQPIVEIETNGTIQPPIFLAQNVAYWNVSPKLTNSGEPVTKRLNIKAINTFTRFMQKAIFKFVVSNEEDLREIEALYRPFILFDYQIWIMPAADNREDLIKLQLEIAQLCIQKRWNMSTRLQLIVWDKATGV